MVKNEGMIKDAFQKVKEEIIFLREEIETTKTLKDEIHSLNLFNRELRNEVVKLCDILEKLSIKIDNINKKTPKIDEKMELYTTKHIPTQRQINPLYSRDIPTQNIYFKPVKPNNCISSIGNQGVPTDTPTDRQTHQQTQNYTQNQPTNTIKPSLLPTSIEQPKPNIDNASEILNTLDNIKKELRLKFKRLTDQEITVFSTIYQLEDEKGYTDYRAVSDKLNLTESSIRDYVGRLIKKGIPIDKIKINNKTIHLSISKNLKKIATLSTILSLRDI